MPPELDQLKEELRLAAIHKGHLLDVLGLFQLLEFQLELVVKQIYQLADNSLRPTRFKHVGGRHQTLGSLILEYEAHTDDDMFVSKLRELKERRNELAHREALLLTSYNMVLVKRSAAKYARVRKRLEPAIIRLVGESGELKRRIEVAKAGRIKLAALTALRRKRT